jgi:DNA-binding GntR family transcriptional regulator
MIKKVHQPLYKNIAETFRGFILQGKWQPGSVIPTETELCQQFSASRATIRKALDSLTQEGYISRKAGKGTWVLEREEEEDWRYSYKSDYPFPEKVNVQIAESDSIAYDPSDAIFNFYGSEKILTRLKVERSLNQTPLAMSEIYLKPAYADKVVKGFDMEKDIYIFRVLERVTGIRIKEVHEIFDAILAVGEIAKRLNVMEGTPLTFITRIFYEVGGQVVQASRVYLRTDVNKFKIVRIRS